jgi:hypothetical protein
VVGERSGPPAVEGEGRGDVVEGVEAPGTAARLGVAPGEADDLRGSGGNELAIGAPPARKCKIGGRRRGKDERGADGVKNRGSDLSYL